MRFVLKTIRNSTRTDELHRHEQLKLCGLCNMFGKQPLNACVSFGLRFCTIFTYAHNLARNCACVMRNLFHYMMERVCVCVCVHKYQKHTMNKSDAAFIVNRLPPFAPHPKKTPQIYRSTCWHNTASFRCGWSCGSLSHSMIHWLGRNMSHRIHKAMYMCVLYFQTLRNLHVVV